MKNIIFIAPPAAGKGTQSDMLCKKYGYIHISTGDILREEALNNEDIKNTMEKGLLVSDDIILTLVKKKLNSIDGLFILDGFPRNLDQAKFLDEIIDDNYVVIYLDLSMDKAVARIDARLTCSCGKSYNLNVDGLKPKVDSICDECGSKLVKRNDDNIESFKVRYETFISNTTPVLEFYQNKSKLVRIDVDRSVEDIFEDISKEVSNG